MITKETSISGVGVYNSTAEELEIMNSHIQALIKHNLIKPVISKVFPLEKASKAQFEVIENSGTFGRITIKM